MAQRPTKESFTLKENYKFTELNNLSSDAKILFATDDFFATAENLLKDHSPEWKEGVFDSTGKWMDGWETRRKRIPGHDFCIIRLAHPSILHGFQLDTSFFTGNFTPKISIQAGTLSPQEEKSLPIRKSETNQEASVAEKTLVGSLTDNWKVLVPKTKLGAGYADTCNTFLAVQEEKVKKETWTHLRLNYYPDGGVARFRIFGQAKRTLEDIKKNGRKLNDGTDVLYDLASCEHGGICIGFSNAHYGHPRNMIVTRPIPNIGDGWETARRLDRPDVITENSVGFMQSPGEEWAVFRLGVAGKVVKVQVDTTCFKGNFPNSCKVEGALLSASAQEKDEQDLISNSGKLWKTLVPLTKMGPDKMHMFDVKGEEKISHVRITIAPDGGIARFRVWGRPE